MDKETCGLIEIYCTGQGWQADFSQASNKRELLSLFHSAILPTAYTAAMPGTTVRAAVQEAYPHAAVRIREDDKF